MKTLTIECEEGWQHSILEGLSQFMMAEHPFAGSAIGAAVVINIKFPDGSANVAVGAMPNGPDLELETYQLIHVAAMARARVLEMLTKGAGLTNDEAANAFAIMLASIAADAKFSGEAAGDFETAMKLARKRANRKDGGL